MLDTTFQTVRLIAHHPEHVAVGVALELCVVQCPHCDVDEELIDVVAHVCLQLM